MGVIATPSDEGRGNLREVESSAPPWDCFGIVFLAITMEDGKRECILAFARMDREITRFFATFRMTKMSNGLTQDAGQTVRCPTAGAGFGDKR